jgi:hypothetical protein
MVVSSVLFLATWRTVMAIRYLLLGYADDGYKGYISLFDFAAGRKALPGTVSSLRDDRLRRPIRPYSSRGGLSLRFHCVLRSMSTPVRPTLRLDFKRFRDEPS